MGLTRDLFPRRAGFARRTRPNYARLSRASLSGFDGLPTANSAQGFHAVHDDATMFPCMAQDGIVGADQPQSDHGGAGT